jgi:hypothetical protein
MMTNDEIAAILASHQKYLESLRVGSEAHIRAGTLIFEKLSTVTADIEQIKVDIALILETGRQPTLPLDFPPACFISVRRSAMTARARRRLAITSRE